MKTYHSNFIRSINVESLFETAEILNEYAVNNDVRVVVINFTDVNFLSIKENDSVNLINIIKNFPKPIITIIDNVAEENLFKIVLASTLCIATVNSSFNIYDRSILKKQLGSKNADKLDNFADKIDAKTAFDLGMINKIVVKEKVKNEALKLAEQISKLSPIAIRYCLNAVNKGLEVNLQEGLEIETKLFAQIFSTADMKEGTSAFLEKRSPNFKGK